MDEVLPQYLRSLIGCSVRVSDHLAEAGGDAGAVAIAFANGTTLRASYWRLIKEERQAWSSFDHRQKYGLPAPVDAIAELRSELEDQIASDARWISETGDLVFRFGDHLTLQVLNFTGYEIWEVQFPDGTTEYSNYCR